MKIEEMLLGFYDRMIDLADRPFLYSIETVDEARAFINGYFYGQGDVFISIPLEPPFKHFSEWLVRKHGVGNSSMLWSTILRELTKNEAEAFKLFSESLRLFSLRKRTIVASVAKSESQRCTSEFQVESYRPGIGSKKIAYVPDRIEIVKYATDEGFYLTYLFESESLLMEYYVNFLPEGQRIAERDFLVANDDWIFYVNERSNSDGSSQREVS